MKISHTIEQAILVMLMLALQKDHRPVKSYVLSERLGVSDSYLKKVLRKLVLAGLISSEAGWDGGFRLTRPLSEVRLGDVYRALEEPFGYEPSGIAGRVFSDEQQIEALEGLVMKVYGRAFEAMNREMDTLPLSKLVHAEHLPDGWYDWDELH